MNILSDSIKVHQFQREIYFKFCLSEALFVKELIADSCAVLNKGIRCNPYRADKSLISDLMHHMCDHISESELNPNDDMFHHPTSRIVTKMIKSLQK